MSAPSDELARELADELGPELLAFADALVEVLLADMRAKAAREARDDDAQAA